MGKGQSMRGTEHEEDKEIGIGWEGGRRREDQGVGGIGWERDRVREGWRIEDGWAVGG